MAMQTQFLVVCFMIWLFRIHHVKCADCDTVFSGIPTFQNCAYRCHCKNDAQCDEQTGSCDNGCEFGWMGPRCQYRNIAQFYTKAQNEGGTSNSAYFAINAVDGDVTTCARTTTAGADSNHRSYWRIDLTQKYRIVGLVVKVRSNEVDDFNRFRVETGTGINDRDFNSICYQHDDIPGSQEMEIMCRQPVWTKHLRIILDKTYTRLRVCEVEIYGGRDLTFNRPTSQSSTYTDPHTNWAWVSSRAVDGRAHTSDITARDTCSATNNENRPYWKVDFLTEYAVQSIYFYGRLQAYGQYSYFEILLIRDNETEPVNLYKEPGNTNYQSYQPKIVDLTTIVTGRHLKVERPLSNSLLSICELVAFGECPPNKCGWDCTVDCHCAAEITGTFQKDGKCPNGCSDRWTGINKTCTLECTSTQWGNQCQNECGHCFQDEPCNVVTGHCEHGCSGPLYRPDCTQECTNNTYGINCEQTCGQCKNSQQCDIHSGDCDQGCVIGKQPPLCQEACSSGTYGDGCTSQCGNCFDGVTCHPETGVCGNGCAPGYLNTFCNKTCDSGWYGVNCADKCGHCKNGMACNVTNGICNDGCQAGWGTAYCDQPCANGTYGEGCDQQCGQCYNNDVCNGTSGRCPNGCHAGFEGEVCKTECSDGKYGRDCAETCGSCNQTSECDKKTGECSGECLPGWLDNMCKTPCQDGSYGLNCTSSCGNCKDGAPCNHETGACTSCAPGYQLDFCTTNCETGTYGHNCAFKCGHCVNGTVCNISDGACPGACYKGYKGLQCTEEIVQKPIDPETSSIGMIIGAAVGTLVAVVIACVVVFIILRRRNAKPKSSHSENGHLSTFSDNIINQEVEIQITAPKEPSSKQVAVAKNPAAKTIAATKNSSAKNVATKTEPTKEPTVYYNACFRKNEIKVSALRQMCVAAKQDPEPFYKEFAEIPYGMQFDASETTDPKFRCKNRYRNMHPYNETRVILPEIPGDELSTYINANYINGYDVPKKYIAAQGTLETTTSDMWRMIWCKNVSTIVMLTNCAELGKVKCVRYWPLEGSERFGDFSLEVVKSEVYTDFVIRTLECTMTSTGKKREVLQFHYTAWPDKDVPDTSLSLVQFWRAVRYNHVAQKIPWVVHCSAGVGRTGTFIALDFLFDCGTAENVVNIQETVNVLREQRLNMVQTKEQYVYVHEIAAEVLTPVGTVCTNDNFSDIYQTLFHKNGKAQQKLIKEFEDLSKYKFEVEDRQDHEEEEGVYCNVFRPQTVDGKKEENLEKSRDIEIIPADIHRPRLTTVVNGRNDFINAVYLPTFRFPDRMILTQVPLENTRVDFLRLIWEHKCKIVVLLEESLPESFSYWPSSATSKQIDVFTTKLTNERVEICYVMRTITLSLDGMTEQKEFYQFHFKSWPENKSSPIDTASILRLITDIENNNNSRGREPMIIQCMNGASKSGLFSTLWCLLEKSKIDNEIGIAETVRLNRMRRKQIIENLEQYKYCHNVMLDYLDSYSVYANTM